MTRSYQMDFTGGPFFDDAAPYITRSATCATTPQIVGDEKQSESQFTAEAVQQIQDLFLHRDVERGCRLVGDQQPRPAPWQS